MTPELATILDGKALARRVRGQLRERVAELQARGIRPKLHAIVAAQDPASVAYVQMKRKWAEEIGIQSEASDVTDQTTQDELMRLIADLNADATVHGVLVQHPLPKHLDEGAALSALLPEKDVDGITPTSLGRLLSDLPGLRPATPLGIMSLLSEYGVPIEGRSAVVVGRSVILGKPMALMLLAAHATVTIAHSRTRNLPDLCRQADIVVAAVGKPEMIPGAWIKPGAVVVDAGYNKVPGRTHDVGDVDFESASKVAGWITPVPGGVGPMTVASLLANTVAAASAAHG
jgi:methylenetetrahydrofolate dehydrogenase (NADP+)/methenyltetrahydrofolate cyclohydrolase